MLLTEGGGDMLSLLTGVGGALSALGREIPAGGEGKGGRRRVLGKVRIDLFFGGMMVSFLMLSCLYFYLAVPLFLFFCTHTRTCFG